MPSPKVEAKIERRTGSEGLFRTILAGPGHTLADAFANLEGAPQVERLLRHSKRDLLSFADSIGATDPSVLPFAALDGDPATAWRSDPYGPAAGQWLEVVLDTPRRVTEVTVDFADDLRVAAAGRGWCG